MSFPHTYFNSVVLYDVDAASIPSPNWLRSNVLAFFFTWLQQQLDGRSASPAMKATTTSNNESQPSITSSSSACWFADTSVVQCMLQFGDANLGPADRLLNSSLLLLPISDYLGATTVNTASHWSLLRVFVEKSGDKGVVRFRHLDSCGASNAQHAQGVMMLLQSFYEGHWKGNVQFVNENHDSAGSRNGLADNPYPQAADNPYPQQPNSHDCGAYVCTAAQCYFDAVLSATHPVGKTGGVGVADGRLLSDPQFALVMNHQRCEQLRLDILELLRSCQ